MSGELELNAEDFFSAAMAFIPVTESQRTSRTTAGDDSAAYDGKWGNDEMGQSFAKSYVPLRTTTLDNANKFVASFDGFRKAYVDARDEFVKRDGANGDLHARIGEEIVTDDGDKQTVESGKQLSAGNETYETPEDIAEDLNTIEDAQEEARDEAKDQYS